MKRIGFPVIAAAVAMFASPALASDKTCSCVVTKPASPAVGKIVASKGSVFLSGTKGLVPAKTGMEMTAGSFLTVGFNASATIAAGTNCTLDIGENSTVSLLPENENRICLQVSGLQDGTGTTTVTELESKSVISLQAFGSGGGFLQGPLPLVVIGGIGVTAVATDNGMPRPASD